MRIRDSVCSRQEKKISNRPLLSRAMQTTARNRPTYFRNSGPLIWRQPVFSAIDVRTVVGPSAPASVAVIRSPRRRGLQVHRYNVRVIEDMIVGDDEPRCAS